MRQGQKFGFLRTLRRRTIIERPITAMKAKRPAGKAGLRAEAAWTVGTCRRLNVVSRRPVSACKFIKEINRTAREHTEQCHAHCHCEIHRPSQKPSDRVQPEPV
ncbi:hypothetical protein PSAB6_520017 [Paraburkholderia sabiae]|nr:hypothetical protein PSAB6_520017 [Paraburkholderia sabiae]